VFVLSEFTWPPFVSPGSARTPKIRYTRSGSITDSPASPPNAQHHHLLRRHRQRDFREHFQCAEALSLPAQDGEAAAAGVPAEMPARQFVKFYRVRQVVWPSTSGTVPSVRSSRRPRSHRSHARRTHGRPGIHGSHRNPGEQRRLAARRCRRFPYRRDGTWRD